MAVIKGAESRSLAKGAIVLDLGDIGRQALALERRAVDRANEIVAQAQTERRRLIENASGEGRAAGLAEGRARGEAEGREAGHAEALRISSARFEALARDWEGALEKFEREREEMLQGARADTLAFAAAVAGRVTRRAVALDPASATELLAAALALTIKPTRLVVEVNPEDHAAASEAAPALLARFACSAHAEVRTIETLSKGSVVVRTDEGVIDATVDTQLQRILDAALPDRSTRFAPPPAPGAGGHDLQEPGP